MFGAWFEKCVKVRTGNVYPDVTYRGRIQNRECYWTQHTWPEETSTDTTFMHTVEILLIDINVQE